MPANTEKSKVLHSFKASFKVLTTKNEPVENMIDGNVKLYVLSHIPDNFQGETEMVFDRQPKSSRVALLQIYRKTFQLSCLGENNDEHRITFDLRHKDLSNK